MSTRSALAPTLSVTVVRGRVNLNAFCSRFPHHRREDLSVSLDRHSILDGHHGESDAPGVCLQCCGRREFVDESGHQELLPILDALRETDLGERATNQSACIPSRLRWSTVPVLPATPTFPVLSTSNAMIAVLSQVPQFMSQEPERARSRARSLRRGWTDSVRARTR